MGALLPNHVLGERRFPGSTGKRGDDVAADDGGVVGALRKSRLRACGRLNKIGDT